MALREFISRVRSVDLARPNKYAVKILGAPVGRDRYIEYMAESVSFPGQNLRASTDLLRYGPQREVAHAMTYGPFSITFMCSTGMPEKLWFEKWQSETINKDTWEAKFYESYVSDMELIALDRSEKDTYTCTVYEAFPKTINAQEFSYGATGSYQTVTVEFSYRWWDSKGTPPAQTPVTQLMTPAVPELNEKKAKTQTDSQMGASDRHPPITNEPFANVPAVPNPADQAFFPSPGQPVAQTPNSGFSEGMGDNRNQ